MTLRFQPRLIVLALACAGTVAMAQPGGHPHRPMDPSQRQEMMAKREAELKAQLQITPAQEPAWAAWVAAMKPPADKPGMGPDERRRMHEEMGKLTTPERIDRMNAMKAERDAQMARRGEATKAFYAALTPQQKKVFDERMHRHGPGGPDGHHGPGGRKPPQQG